MQILTPALAYFEHSVVVTPYCPYSRIVNLCLSTNRASRKPLMCLCPCLEPSGGFIFHDNFHFSNIDGTFILSYQLNIAIIFALFYTYNFNFFLTSICSLMGQTNTIRMPSIIFYYWFQVFVLEIFIVL